MQTRRRVNRRPERLAVFLPGVVADLAQRHTQPNRRTNMAFAPDHGPYTDDLDAMTMDELLRVRRLLQEEKRLSHLGPDTLEIAVREEIQYRDQLRHDVTGGAA
jgi:hypothetical protein